MATPEELSKLLAELKAQQKELNDEKRGVKRVNPNRLQGMEVQLEYLAGQIAAVEAEIAKVEATPEFKHLEELKAEQSVLDGISFRDKTPEQKVRTKELQEEINSLRPAVVEEPTAPTTPSPVEVVTEAPVATQGQATPSGPNIGPRGPLPESDINTLITSAARQWYSENFGILPSQVTAAQIESFDTLVGKALDDANAFPRTEEHIAAFIKAFFFGIDSLAPGEENSILIEELFKTKAFQEAHGLATLTLIENGVAQGLRQLDAEAGPSYTEVRKQLRGALQAIGVDLSSDESLLWLDNKIKNIIQQTTDAVLDDAFYTNIIDWDVAWDAMDEFITAETANGKEGVIDAIEQFTGTPSNQTLLDDWLDASDIAFNNKHILGGQLSEFERLWAVADTDETFGEFLQSQGGGHSPQILADVRTISSGQDSPTGRKAAFQKAARRAGILPENPTQAQLLAVNNAFNQLENDYADALLTDPSTSFATMMNEALTTIPRPEVTTKREASRFGVLPPGFMPDMAFKEAVDRLEDRVGKEDFATLADGIRSRKKEIEGLQTELEGFIGDDVNASEIQAEIDTLQAQTDKMISQTQEKAGDITIATQLMNNPQLAQAFASGSEESLRFTAGQLGLSKEEAGQLVTSQGRQGLVDTSKGVAGINIPSFAADPEVVAASKAERDAALAIQQKNTVFTDSLSPAGRAAKNAQTALEASKDFDPTTTGSTSFEANPDIESTGPIPETSVAPLAPVKTPEEIAAEEEAKRIKIANSAPRGTGRTVR